MVTKFVIMEFVKSGAVSFLGEKTGGDLIWASLATAYRYDTREEAESDMALYAQSNSATIPGRDVTVSVEEITE